MSKNLSKAKDNKYNEFPNELKDIIKYGEWEHKIITSLTNQIKSVEKLILVDKEYMNQWRELKGYNKTKDYIFDFINNKENKTKKIILKEIWDKNLNSQSLSSVILKRLPSMKIDRLLSNVNQKIINNKSNFEFISEELYPLFQNKMNMKIEKEGKVNKGKLMVNIDDKSFYLKYLKNNEFEEVLIEIPKEEKNSKKIFNEFVEKDIKLFYNDFTFNNVVKKELYLNDSKNNKYKYYAIPRNKINKIIPIKKSQKSKSNSKLKKNSTNNILKSPPKKLSDKIITKSNSSSKGKESPSSQKSNTKEKKEIANDSKNISGFKNKSTSSKDKDKRKIDNASQKYHKEIKNNNKESKENELMKSSGNESNNLLDILEDEINEIILNEKENEFSNKDINDNINNINNIVELNEKKEKENEDNDNDELNCENKKFNNSNNNANIINKKEYSTSSNKMIDDNNPKTKNEENNNTIISIIQEGDEKYNNIAIYESKSKPNPFSLNNGEINNKGNKIKDINNMPYIKKYNNAQNKKDDNSFKINDKINKNNNDSEEVLTIDRNEINYNNPIYKKNNKNQEIKNNKIDSCTQNSEKGSNNISCFNSPKTNITTERNNRDNNNNIKSEKINSILINETDPIKNYKYNNQINSFDDCCAKTIQNIEDLDNKKNIDKELINEEPKDNKLLYIKNDNINEKNLNINNKDSNNNNSNEKEMDNLSLTEKSKENMNNNSDNNIINNINEPSIKDMEINHYNIINQPNNQINKIGQQKEIIINDKNELPINNFSNEDHKNNNNIEKTNDNISNNNKIIKSQRIKNGIIPTNQIINNNNSQDKMPQQIQMLSYNNNNRNNIPLKTIMIYDNNKNLGNNTINNNKNDLPKVNQVYRINSSNPNQNHSNIIKINKSFNDKRSLQNHNSNYNNKFNINSPKNNNDYKVFKINKLYSKSPPPSKEKYRMINHKKIPNKNSINSESQSITSNPNRIDPNILAQYMLFKRLENNELKEELRNEKDQIQLENKVLKRNLSCFEKEKEKFNREKKLFLNSRDRIIKDFRMNEERLKKLENDLENKFRNKKNEIEVMKMRLNEKENNLNNEKEKIRNEYENKIKDMENKYQKKDNEDLNRKEYELKNKEIELINKENDLNNKYQNLQNLDEEKINKEKHINMLNKEIQDKEIKIIELENKYNELSSSMNTNTNKNNTFNDNKSDINTIGNNNINNSNRSYNDEYAYVNDNNDTPEDNDIYKESNIDKIKEELFIEKYNPCIGLYKTEGPNYLNEILQCFAHISEITDYLINIHLDPYFKDKLSNLKLSKYYREVLINLFFPEKVFNLNNRPYQPNKFVNNLYNLNSLFQKNAYIDYKEFLDYFIIKLHDELNVKKSNNNYSNEKNLTLKNENDVLVEFLQNFTNKNNSIISKYLYGICKNILYCHKCRNTFYDFHYYSYLYFDLSKVIEYKQNKYHNDDISINITDCLNYFQRTQTLLGDKGLFCPVCKELTESTSIKNLYSSKTILLFVLNRDNQFNAQDNKINLEEVINIGDYIEFNKEKGGKNSKEKFYLSGVVNYFGDNYGNEIYTAYCRMSKDEQWYCYENENIYLANFKDIQNNGYPIILFYHKILKK